MDFFPPETSKEKMTWEAFNKRFNVAYKLLTLYCSDTVTSMTAWLKSGNTNCIPMDGINAGHAEHFKTGRIQGWIGEVGMFVGNSL